MERLVEQDRAERAKGTIPEATVDENRRGPVCLRKDARGPTLREALPVVNDGAELDRAKGSVDQEVADSGLANGPGQRRKRRPQRRVRNLFMGDRRVVDVERIMDPLRRTGE